MTSLVRDGRPAKLEGSALPPASLGATDVAEADIPGLYDPGRLRAPEMDDGPRVWDAFADALAPRMARAGSGEGVRLAAAAGVLWAAFLFLLAGADVLART